MREILFRGKTYGKTPSDEKWIEGCYIWHPPGGGVMNSYYYIVPIRGEKTGIKRWTAGQFTGLLDKNGLKIFEGDIVECDMLGHTMQRAKMRGVVKFNDGCFDVEFKSPFVDKNMGCNRYRDYVKCFVCNSAVEVIGNIHDNPELLQITEEKECTTE